MKEMLVIKRALRVRIGKKTPIKDGGNASDKKGTEGENRKKLAIKEEDSFKIY